MKRLLVCLVVTLLVAQAILVPIANAQEETKEEQVQPKPEHEPMLALLFGLIIPGGAQFYNGDTNEAIKAFAITVGTAIAWTCLSVILSAAGVGFILWLFPIYFVPWVWYAYQGYLKAQKIQAGTVMNLYQMESTSLTTK
ncbi:MAG TPA: hypothetical protein EYP60_07745 [bacterium (Candidatus Stahlbacteria)]|nr:hypothetical protein [Candidatus Stahlbacteria bacterium]